MKKNEKGFMQEEKNLEKVAGGAMASGVGVETDVKARDVNFSLVETNVNNTDNRSYNNSKTEDYRDFSVRGDRASVRYGDIHF